MYRRQAGPGRTSSTAAKRGDRCGLIIGPASDCDAVLLSREDYEALEETAHLLRVPANARRLIESLQQALSGQREEHNLAR